MIGLMDVNRIAAQLKEDETRACWQKTQRELFLSTPSSTIYDPLPATLELVERYKTTIDFGMNIDKSEWRLGPWPVTTE